MTDLGRSCLSVAALAFTGGLARLFYSYRPGMGYAAGLRIVTTGLYVGIVVGLVVWEPLAIHETMRLALIGATSWLGVDLARSVFEMIVRRLLGGREVNGNNGTH